MLYYVTGNFIRNDPQRNQEVPTIRFVVVAVGSILTQNAQQQQQQNLSAIRTNGKNSIFAQIIYSFNQRTLKVQFVIV